MHLRNEKIENIIFCANHKSHKSYLLLRTVSLWLSLTLQMHEKKTRILQFKPKLQDKVLRSHQEIRDW